MSIFKKSNRVEDIKSKDEFLQKISKGVGINYIGTNDRNCMRSILHIVSEYMNNEFERELGILTSITPVQMVYKLSGILGEHAYHIADEGNLIILTFDNMDHKIYVQKITSRRLDLNMFAYNLQLIMQLPDYSLIDVKNIKEITTYNKNNSNLTILVDYGEKDMSMFTILRLGRYIDNMGFIMYDDVIGDTCFIDILNNKRVVYIIREEGITTS